MTMYLIVNSDLQMGKGKAAAQVGHAVMHLMLQLTRRPTPEYERWLESGAAKIVLRAPQAILELLKRQAGAVAVHDAGLTQIASGSLTVVGLPPMSPGRLPGVVNTLKLL